MRGRTHVSMHARAPVSGRGRDGRDVPPPSVSNSLRFWQRFYAGSPELRDADDAPNARPSGDPEGEHGDDTTVSGVAVPGMATSPNASTARHVGSPSVHQEPEASCASCFPWRRRSGSGDSMTRLGREEGKKGRREGSTVTPASRSPHEARGTGGQGAGASRVEGRRRSWWGRDEDQDCDEPLHRDLFRSAFDDDGSEGAVEDGENSPSMTTFGRFDLQSSSSRHPPFTQSPFPPRPPVRGGQTSPHKPRLVVSRSTCPPLSSSPHAHSFAGGTVVINNNKKGTKPHILYPTAQNLPSVRYIDHLLHVR